MKWLIVSDLHLGSRASRAAQSLDVLCRLSEQAGRVVFNGDTLDKFYGTDAQCDSSGTEHLERLRAVRGVGGQGPTFLTGNHDPGISEEHWLYHEESATLIVHGDALADCTHPTKHEEQQLMRHFSARWQTLGGRPTDLETLHRHYRAVQLEFLPVINPYKKSKTAWQYAKSLLYPPRRPFDILRYWRGAPRLALKMARGFPRPLKHLVFGHSHRAGRWLIDGVEVINTGSFMPFSEPYAVELEGADVRFMPLRVLAERVRESVPVNATVSAGTSA
jgi:UDP-2,3-diacylglucosamine pyrophosphatase LpxH